MTFKLKTCGMFSSSMTYESCLLPQKGRELSKKVLFLSISSLFVQLASQSKTSLSHLPCQNYRVGPQNVVVASKLPWLLYKFELLEILPVPQPLCQWWISKLADFVFSPTRTLESINFLCWKCIIKGDSWSNIWCRGFYCFLEMQGDKSFIVRKARKNNIYTETTGSQICLRNWLGIDSTSDHLIYPGSLYFQCKRQSN